jgi:predicted acetyltransferase
VIQAYSSLVELERKYEAQLVSLFEDFQAAGEEGFLSDWERAQGDIAAYVERLKDFSRGVGLAKGVVPESTYWLIREGKVFVGFSRLRHRFVPALEHHGGHIGYAIRPSQRRKGYGTRPVPVHWRRFCQPQSHSSNSAPSSPSSIHSS